jgi:hypothetical protein
LDYVEGKDWEMRRRRGVENQKRRKRRGLVNEKRKRRSKRSRGPQTYISSNVKRMVRAPTAEVEQANKLKSRTLYKGFRTYQRG